MAGRGKSGLNQPFIKAWRVGCFLLAHLLVTLGLIAVIEVVRWALSRLDDPKLFDFIPLRYVFDAMDMGILIVFLIMGTFHAVAVFRAE